MEPKVDEKNEVAAVEPQETAPEQPPQNTELEELRAENQRLSVFQDKVRELAEADPQAAAFLHDLITTGNIGVALSENYSDEEVQALLEEARSEEYETHRNNYSGKVNKAKERQSELEKNKEKSQMTAQEFVDKYQPEESDLEGFIAFYDGLMKDAIDNNMSLDHWERLWKAYKYDSTKAELENKIVEAEENGKVIGRNEKIVQGKKSREDLAGLLPEVSGGGATSNMEKPKTFGGQFLNGVL